MPSEFLIGKTKVGGNNPCFIVAEIGINFDGKYENAIKLIDVAAKAGCNAVKFQLFRAESMYAPKAGRYKTASGGKKDIIKIIKEGELPPEWIPKLKNYAQKMGMEFFATTCDEKSTDILAKYKVSAYKFASYEITHIPLFKYTAKKGKPIIFSSGGSTLQEIIEAMEAIKKEGNNKIALLHCIGQYPAAISSLNLSVIPMLKMVFPDVVIGYSDHSLDPETAPMAAIALGAKIIEKHITLDKRLPGPDHSFALNPDELFLMVKAIRKTEEELKKGKKIVVSPIIMGKSEKKICKGEKWTRSFAYRCIFAIKNIKKGEIITKRNTAVLRPGNAGRGLAPKYYDKINGYAAAEDIGKYSPIRWQDLAKRAKNPEITVIIRAYNSEKFIGQAIESVLKQTLSPKFYEILIVNDGSSDKTAKVLNQYRGIIKIIRQKHKGPAAALNRGIKEAIGKYITILDSDDLFLPDMLFKMLDVFKKNKNIDFAYCDYKEISVGGNAKIISLAKNIFNGVAAGFVFKKKLLNSVGGFDEKFIFPEYDLLIKIIDKYNGRHIAIPLFIYRRRIKSITASKKNIEKGKKQLFLKYNKNFNIRDY